MTEEEYHALELEEHQQQEEEHCEEFQAFHDWLDDCPFEHHVEYEDTPYNGRSFRTTVYVLSEYSTYEKPGD